MRTDFPSRCTKSGIIAALAICLIPTSAGAHSGPVTRKVPSQYATIQAAVNAASPGDTISVSKKPGNSAYYESVTVTTNHLTITAANGVVVDGGGPSGSGNGFNLLGNNDTLEGFTIQNFLKDQTNLVESPRDAVSVLGATDTEIDGITATNNDEGVDAEDCASTDIEGSTFAGNLQEAIYVISAFTTNIMGNNITGNSNGNGYFNAVALVGVDTASIEANNVTNNANGIYVATAAQGPNPPGIPQPGAVQVVGNVVSGNQGDSITVDGSYLVTVSLNMLSKNLFGMAFIDGSLQCQASVNMVTGTTLATYENAGIAVGGGSALVTVAGNVVTSNQSDGIAAFGSAGNTFSHNLATNNNGPGSFDEWDDSGSTASTVLNTWSQDLYRTSSPTGLG